MQRTLRRYAQQLRWGARTNVQAHRLGLDWRLDLRDNVQRHLYREGNYEPELTQAILRALPDHGVYVDVGAHIGIHALPVAQAKPRARVVAFEPSPDTANRLRYAARQLPNVELVQTALGSAPGRLQLKGDPEFDSHDAAVRSAAGTGEVVGEFPVDTLDRFHLDRLDVLKLDIEGHEYEALRGARNTLQRLRPTLVAVEIQQHLLVRAGVPGSAIETLLGELGYRTDRSLGRNVLFRSIVA